MKPVYIVPLILLLLTQACIPDDDNQDILVPYFKGVINNENVIFNNDHNTFSLSGGGGITYEQSTVLGTLWGANPNGIEISIFLSEKPNPSFIESLEGQSIPFYNTTLPLVSIKVFTGASLLDVEISEAELNQNNSNFKILEVIEDKNYQLFRPNFTVGKAYFVKGVCNFKTPNLIITDGEFVIRLVELK